MQSDKHMYPVPIEVSKQRVEWKDRHHSDPLDFRRMEWDSMWQDSKTSEKQKGGFGERLSPAQIHQNRKRLSKHKSSRYTVYENCFVSSDGVSNSSSSSINELERNSRSGYLLVTMKSLFPDMQKLKKLKFDDETVRQRGDTALHLAVQNNDYILCCQLVDEGADVNHLNRKCMTPIMLAAKIGSEDVLSHLVKHPDARLDIGDQNIDTALHLAALNNHTACLRLLIGHSADLNICNNKMQTALHIAVSQKYMDCVKILVESKAKIDMQDEDGNTPLHNAIRLHNIHEMKKMIAKFELEDIFRFTGDLQRGSDKPKYIAIYLAEHGASLDTPNNYGKSPLNLCQDKLLQRKLRKIQSENSSVSKASSVVAEPESTGEDTAQLQITIQNLQDEIRCVICHKNRANIAFNCGHRACDDCEINLHDCHMCRARIDTRIRIY